MAISNSLLLNNSTTRSIGDGAVIYVVNGSATVAISDTSAIGNQAGDDGGVIAVNNNTELFVSTPSNIFNTTNEARDGDFLFSRNDISGEIQGFGFDTDFLIF